MRHPIRFLSILGLLALTVAAGPVWSADEASISEPDAVSAAAPDPTGCAGLEGLDLPAIPGISEIPMTPAETPVVSPEGFPLEASPQKGPPPIRRYCKCGCGVGCTSDEDCGPGGSCVAFISCC